MFLPEIKLSFVECCHYCALCSDCENVIDGKTEDKTVTSPHIW